MSLRIVLILTAVAMVIGGTLSMIKVPNIRGQERVLARYKVDQEGTLISLRAAILTCVPGIAQSRMGAQFTRTFIAPIYLKILFMRQDGADPKTISAQVKKWIVADHQTLLTSVPDRELIELAGYASKLGEDDVENCVLDAAAERDNLNENAKGWNIRA